MRLLRIRGILDSSSVKVCICARSYESPCISTNICNAHKFTAASEICTITLKGTESFISTTKFLKIQ